MPAVQNSPKPRRVMFCMTGPNQLNGPNIWLLRHLPRLKAMGLEVELLYLTYEMNGVCANRDAVAAMGIPVHSLQYAFNVEDDVANILALLAGNPPDVFVPNYVVAAHYAARYLKELGAVQSIGVLHADEAFYHDIIDLFVAGNTQWKLDAVVCVSDYLYGSLKEKQTELPLIYAPCGAPLPPHTVSYKDPLCMVYMGRFVERQKRITRVVERFYNATKNIHGTVGVFYGAGEDQPKMDKWLAEHPKNENVKIVGKIPPEKIFEAMQSCHLFVLLSDFEGFSIALVEAMGAGLVPVVARMRSGIMDLIKDGQNGFIIDADDATAFENVVRTMRENPQRWQTMSQAARATVIEMGFTSDACAQRWYDLIAKLPVKTVVPFAAPTSRTIILPQQTDRADGMRPFEHRSIRKIMDHCAEIKRPIVVWGASRCGELFFDNVATPQMNIIAVLDSDPNKSGKLFRGIPISLPAPTLEPLAKDSRKPYVVVASYYFAEISQTLNKLGYMENDDYARG